VCVPLIRCDVGAAGASEVVIAKSWHMRSAVVFPS
jgi:hypothetical protein